MSTTITARTADPTAHTEPAHLAGIHHVALITADLDRLVQFYRDVLDVHVWLDLTEEGMRHAMFDVGAGASLHAFEQPDNGHAEGVDAVFDRGHLDHLALRVADEASFETLRGRLVDAGASDGTVIDFGVAREIVFRDPDGHTLELALAVPSSTPRTFSERTIELFEPPRTPDGGRT